MVSRRTPPAPTSRWWWIRHAAVAAAPGLILPADVPAVIGAAEERRLAALRRTVPEPAIHLTSTLARAVMPARRLSHVPAQQIGALREQDFGAWTGSTHAALWDSGEPLYRAFLDQPTDTSPPGGENFAQMCARVAAAIAELATLHAGIDLVIVAHAGPIRAALALALDLAPDRALRLAIDHLSLTRLELTAGNWRVGQVNA